MYIKRCILRCELKSIYLNIFNNNDKYFILLFFEIIKFLFEILLIIEIEFDRFQWPWNMLAKSGKIFRSFSLLISYQSSEKKYSWHYIFNITYFLGLMFGFELDLD